MSKKRIKSMVSTLIAIALVGGVALVILLNESGAKDKQSDIDEMVANSIKTDEITTDLQDGSFVRVQFQIVTDSERAKKELEKRQFQLKNILIKELATMSEKDFESNLSKLEETLNKKLNEVMQDGKVISVYTINKILQ